MVNKNNDKPVAIASFMAGIVTGMAATVASAIVAYHWRIAKKVRTACDDMNSCPESDTHSNDVHNTGAESCGESDSHSYEAYDGDADYRDFDEHYAA